VTASIEELSARYGPAYRWCVTATVMAGLIAMVASATIVNVAMPDIMGEMGLGQDQAQWLSTAFLASMTTAMLVSNWAVQRFGQRASFATALAAFTLGSIMGGFATDDTVLIVARAIQGLAAGIAQPMGMLSIFQAFPANRRGTAMGIYGMGVILAPAIGPTVGGMLIDSFSWRYTFAMGLPFCLLGIALSLIFLPTRSSKEVAPFDLLGFLLLSVGVASFLAAISNGQRMGWDSGFVLGAFVAAAGATVAFVIRELRTANPILALEVYRNPRFVAASVVAFILGMGLYGSTYLVPLFVQTIQGYSPTESGLLLMPAGIALGFVFPLAGRLSDHVNASILIMIGLAVFGISSALMIEVGTSTWFWTFAGWVMLGRIGLGFILPSLNGGSLRVLDRHLMGHGSGAINFVRQLGGALGVGILSVYLERQTAAYATEFAAMQSGSSTAANALRALTISLRSAGLGSGTARATARGFLSRMLSAQASMMGFRESFLLVAAAFLIALVPAYFIRARRGAGQGV